MHPPQPEVPSNQGHHAARDEAASPVALLDPTPYLPHPPRVPAGYGRQDGWGGGHHQAEFDLQPTPTVPGIKISMFKKYVMNVNERSKFIFKKYLTAVCGVSFRLIDKIYH